MASPLRLNPAVMARRRRAYQRHRYADTRDDLIEELEKLDQTQGAVLGVLLLSAGVDPAQYDCLALAGIETALGERRASLVRAIGAGRSRSRATPPSSRPTGRRPEAAVLEEPGVAVERFVAAYDWLTTNANSYARARAETARQLHDLVRRYDYPPRFISPRLLLGVDLANQMLWLARSFNGSTIESDDALYGEMQQSPPTAEQMRDLHQAGWDVARLTLPESFRQADILIAVELHFEAYRRHLEGPPSVSLSKPFLERGGSAGG